MTGLSGAILFLISFYATFNFFRLYVMDRKIFHFCMGTTAAFLALYGASAFLALFFPVLDPEFIGEWSTVFSVSFLLSAAAALVRDFKPVFSRFPKSFTFLPLVLIFIYPMIIDTVVLKYWVLGLYQGSALLIALLIYAYRTYENSDYAYMLIGVIFFAITFLLYWIPESLFTLPEYAWMLLTSSGILILTVGYNQAYNLDKHFLDQEKRKETWFA